MVCKIERGKCTHAYAYATVKIWREIWRLCISLIVGGVRLTNDVIVALLTAHMHEKQGLEQLLTEMVHRIIKLEKRILELEMLE